MEQIETNGHAAAPGATSELRPERIQIPQALVDEIAGNLDGRGPFQKVPLRPERIQNSLALQRHALLAQCEEWVEEANGLMGLFAPLTRRKFERVAALMAEAGTTFGIKPIVLFTSEATQVFLPQGVAGEDVGYAQLFNAILTGEEADDRT